jgi:hypothetical protein
MSGPRAGIWLGDATDVIDALGLVSEDGARRIAPMLGMEFAERQAVPPTPGAEPAVGLVAAEPTPPTPAMAVTGGGDRLRSFVQLALPPLKPVEVQPLSEPPAELAAQALPEEAQGERPPTLPFRPLLRPRTGAGVVAAAVRTWGPGSRIDERRAVAVLARGRPLRELPRRPRLSMHRGVQVLVDLGEALDPYDRDREYVVDLIRQVVGPELTTVGSFENCPSRGVWMQRRAAPRGRPVLLLTDLGLGGRPVQPVRASVAEWYRYAKDVGRAGSPVIALVPYLLDRAHRAIRRRIAVVQWDHATVSTVRHARRRVS